MCGIGIVDRAHREIAREARFVPDDLHSAATQNEGWARDERVADLFCSFEDLLAGRSCRAGRLLQIQAPHEIVELLPVFGELDRFDRRAENGDACIGERPRQVERRLPPILNNHA